MPETSTTYPVSVSIDYPDRNLNRLTTFFRIFLAIPILIIISLLTSTNYGGTGESSESYQYAAAGMVFLPLVLMILFRHKYPKWWFDWNVVPPNGSEIPRPLTIPEIKAIIARFGEVAYRAIEAGFDSIELHGAHGYLLCQFLSPFTNKRNDAYGGNLAGRLLFPLEAIKEVKTRLGENVPLFYRFGADDMVEGGLTRQETKLAARHLEQAGVDVIDVSGGLGGDGQERFTEQGYFIPLAEGIKGMVKVPVIGVGNITEPEYADRIVREQRVDMVAFGRMLLSNPEFPKQAAQKLGVKL